MSNNDSLVGFTSTPQASDWGSEPVLLHFGSGVLGTSSSGNTGCLSTITSQFVVFKGPELQYSSKTQYYHC